MKRSSKELKALARDTLVNRYGSFMGIFLVYLLITIGMNMLLNVGFPYRYTVVSAIISRLAAVIIALIVSVFSVGLIRFALNMCRGQDYRLSDLFFGFRTHPDRIIVAQFVLVLITEIIFIPSTVFSYMGGAFSDGYRFLMIQAVLFLICSLVSFSVTLGLQLSMYLLCDYDNLSAVQALKESWHLMRGNKARLFYLSLSFFGVYLLGILSCGIGLLWVYPYMQVTLGYFYLDIIGEL